MNKDKKITVHLYNGINNRLLPLISAIRMIKKSDKNVLKLIWTYTPIRSCIPPDDNIITYFSDLFEEIDIKNKNNEKVKIEIINYDDNLKNLENEELYEFHYWNNKKYIINENDENIMIKFSLFTFTMNIDDTESIFNRIHDSFIKSCKMNLNCEIGKELSMIINDNLKPKKYLQNEIDNVKSKFRKNMIGIHIRNTDGGFTNIDWNKISDKLINYLFKYLENKKDELGIFVSSDKKEMIQKFENHEKLKDYVIIYKPKLTLGEYYKENQYTNKDEIESLKYKNTKYNILCGMIDLHLLGNCNHKIIGTSGSSFSMCSMLLSNSKFNKEITKPEFWFIQKEEDLESIF
jgi:hypothetical protein